MIKSWIYHSLSTYPCNKDALRKAEMLELQSRIAASLSARERGVLSLLLGHIREYANLQKPPISSLSQQEQEFVQLLDTRPAPLQGLRSQTYMIMKATRYCNLRCTYCHSWKDNANQIMSFEVLATATREALLSPTVSQVEFVWHGGEVTILPEEFFHKALVLQEHYRQPGVRVGNSIQTNGYRLTDSWLDMVINNGIGIGISLDGPPELHDQRRLTANGEPTFREVRSTIERLQNANIPFGILRRHWKTQPTCAKIGL